MDNVIPIGEITGANFFDPAPEFDPPARGVWNIVHTGMLIPEAHQIFVCAQGCLRGVVLTAAEMGALDRMSSVCITDRDIALGLENGVAQAAAEILHSLSYTPKVILLYFSCMHLLSGCDIKVITDRVKKETGCDTIDCYMAPTMRKSMTPDAKMRMQLYQALSPLPCDHHSVNIIGNDRPTDDDSELTKIIRENGFTLRDITLCRTYEEYLDMASSFLNITYLPSAVPAGRSLSFGTHLHLCNSFDVQIISEQLHGLSDSLGVKTPDMTALAAASEDALSHLHKVIGDRAVAVDYTAVTRPFDLALALVRHGMNVKYIIADSLGEDKDEFFALQKLSPDIRIVSAVHADMIDFKGEPDVIAVGQKAAYYFETDNFVNIVANGGSFGFSGLMKMCSLIEDACLHKKDHRLYIRQKGIGLPTPFREVI